MKRLLILALASMVGGGALAQTTTTLSPIKWGLKAGVNFPKYDIQVDNGDVETDATTNFHVTGFIDAPIARNFSVQPGLSLQGKGAEFSDNNEQNTMWLEVPVNLVGTLPVGRANLFLGAGPYAAFGIAGENEVGDVDTDVDFGDEATDDLKGTDFGLNFMGGIRMNSGLMVGAGYGLGLTDLRPTGEGGNGKVTNRVWSVSLGWSF